VVASGHTNISAHFARGQYFTTDRAGTLDATIDYTFAESAIVVWIARGRCAPEQFGAGGCDFAATSFAGEKPRRVSITSAAAGQYTIVVGNGGPKDEAISYQVVLTPSVAAASVGAAGAPATALESWTLPEAMRR
jgi:hypothetical protein